MMDIYRVYVSGGLTHEMEYTPAKKRLIMRDLARNWVLYGDVARDAFLQLSETWVMRQDVQVTFADREEKPLVRLDVTTGDTSVLETIAEVIGR